jgi:hypothetical protein
VCDAGGATKALEVTVVKNLYESLFGKLLIFEGYLIKLFLVSL